jgi:hypothetical protein
MPETRWEAAHADFSGVLAWFALLTKGERESPCF